MKKGVYNPNSQGLVTTTAGGNDLVHTLKAAPQNKAKIRKIMWSNNTGVDTTLIFGTLDNAAIPAFVAELPTITALTGFDGEMNERDIPDVEFALNGAAAPGGRSGNIIVTCPVAGVLVRITVEER